MPPRTDYRDRRPGDTIGPVAKAKTKRERTPAQVAAFERMREANRQKILREAGVGAPPDATPPPTDRPPTFRGRAKAKPKAKSRAGATRGRGSPPPASSQPPPASSDNGGGFWHGLREGLGT